MPKRKKKVTKKIDAPIVATITSKPSKNDWRQILKKYQNRVLAVFGIVFILFLVGLIFLLKDLPSPTSLTNNPPPLTTKIYDRNGKLLYNVFTDENRTNIPFTSIPKDLQNATIAVEDKDFYSHHGINLTGGIFRAIRDSVLKQSLQGGSTITQQLVKMSLLSSERTITRKIKEAVLALWLERIYSKEEILTMYLNRVPYGGTAYGIEEASQLYFSKHAKDLNLAESSLLAGLPQAPTYYSPFGTDPNRAIDRQKHVLDRMLEEKYITKEQYDLSLKTSVVFASQSADLIAPHFVAYVRDQLLQKYGEEKLAAGGLQVLTSLDLDLQKAAQATVSAEIDKQKNLKVGNGSALITHPQTGEILAMVGSKDYFASDGGKVNITLAQRSPGSSIKPLNVALGFLKGNSTPATAWIDGRFCFPPFNGKSYCPNNYDGKFHGVVQTRFALGNSLNIPAVKQLALNTLPDFIATASAMGLTTLTETDRYGYSLALGGGEVKMVDMATAFGVLANAGRREDLVSVLKVIDSSGNTLLDETERIKNLESSIKERTQPGWDGSKPYIPNGKWVLPSEVTFLISHILLDDSARSMTFGAGSVLNVWGKPVSVKTGTTEDKRDNWTIGYTSGNQNRLVAVWVGNNDNKPMSQFLESGNTGAAPIWNGLMKLALQNISVDWPQKPENVVFAQVCSLSGLLPDHGCPERGEYFIKGFLPKEKDNVWDQRKKVWVFKDTGKQATGNFNSDQVHDQDHLVISDPLQKDYCIDCVQ